MQSHLGEVSFEVNHIDLALKHEFGVETCKVARYDVGLENGKIILYKLLSTNEWFPNGLNGHFPVETINEIKKLIDERVA